jgi:hypothetical protein
MFHVLYTPRFASAPLANQTAREAYGWAGCGGDPDIGLSRSPSRMQAGLLASDGVREVRLSARTA